MIFDRTEEYVIKALEIIKNKIRINPPNFTPVIDEPLTDLEMQTLERGCITPSTLYRISDEEFRLSILIKEMGYMTANVEKKEWHETEIATLKDFSDLFDVAQKLKDSFYHYSTTPEIPEAKYHFSNLNGLEKNLYDLGVMINNVKSNYRFCGEVECGE